MICRVCKVGIDDKPKTPGKRVYHLCRSCANEKWRKYRRARIEAGDPMKVTKMPYEYHAEYTKKWTEKNREKICLYAKAARLRSPKKAKARDLVNKALKNGSLSKKPCRVCLSSKSEAHHPDYDKPLEVIWLCRKHHRDEHKKIKSNLLTK